MSVVLIVTGYTRLFEFFLVLPDVVEAVGASNVGLFGCGRRPHLFEPGHVTITVSFPVIVLAGVVVEVGLVHHRDTFRDRADVFADATAAA